MPFLAQHANEELQSEMASEREVSEEPASSYDEAEIVSGLDDEDGQS